MEIMKTGVSAGTTPHPPRIIIAEFVMHVTTLHSGMMSDPAKLAVCSNDALQSPADSTSDLTFNIDCASVCFAEWSYSFKSRR